LSVGVRLHNNVLRGTIQYACNNVLCGCMKNTYDSFLFCDKAKLRYFIFFFYILRNGNGAWCGFSIEIQRDVYFFFIQFLNGKHIHYTYTYIFQLVCMYYVYIPKRRKSAYTRWYLKIRRVCFTIRIICIVCIPK